MVTTTCTMAFVAITVPSTGQRTTPTTLSCASVSMRRLRPAASEKPRILFTKPEDTFRHDFELMIRDLQDKFCNGLEQIDGTKFREDYWNRPEGGGGVSKVLQNGNVFEKAGVAVSVVHGTISPDAVRAAVPGGLKSTQKKKKTEDSDLKVPFFAAGISSVLHPWNPMCPTAHFNYRYFEVAGAVDSDGTEYPPVWWVGGGADLTPSYLFEEDARDFHQKLKTACDKHDASFYQKFKKWCDEYFLIKHRGERRGVGGIFFDDLNDRPKEKLLEFQRDCGDATLDAYAPIVMKRKDLPFTEEQKRWQQLRRGRYVEFNLIYDRGTIFGLKSGGRVESIMMSLPVTARWEYSHGPAKGTEEDKLLQACITPREWVQ